MNQHDTIYNNAHASSDTLATISTPIEQPSVLDFEALGEALVRTDSVMYRESVSDSVATAEAAAIYGGLSQTVAPRLHDRSATNSPFTSSVAFQTSVIALLVVYVLLIYRFRSDIVALLSNHKALREEIENSSQGSIYGRFFSTTVGVGLLLSAIMVVKGADLVPAMASGVIAPSWIYTIAVPAVLIVTMVVLAVQIALLWVIGGVAMCSDVTSMLLRLRKISFSIFAILCAPSVLLYALSEIGQSKVFLYLIVAEVITFLVIFLYETFVLFVSKKISVLHWILYLCTVELFPVSLIVLTVMREF